jgi:hypothetical protein
MSKAGRARRVEYRKPSAALDLYQGRLLATCPAGNRLVTDRIGGASPSICLAVYPPFCAVKSCKSGESPKENDAETCPIRGITHTTRSPCATPSYRDVQD